MLDVGYAFAEPAYLAGLVGLGAPELMGVDLAEAEVPGLRSVVGDVRALPFDERSFDLAICISTLEHIGRDNKIYGLGKEDDSRARCAPCGHCTECSAATDGSSSPCRAARSRTSAGRCSCPPAEWVALFEDAGFVVFEDEIYELGDGRLALDVAVRSGRCALRRARAGRVGGAVRGAAAAAVSERVRLAVRDVRHRGEPRRSTRGR